MMATYRSRTGSLRNKSALLPTRITNPADEDGTAIGEKYPDERTATPRMR